VNFEGELHNKMSADIVTILAQLIGDGGLFGEGEDDDGELEKIFFVYILCKNSNELFKSI
jgi:hypothetical protein